MHSLSHASLLRADCHIHEAIARSMIDLEMPPITSLSSSHAIILIANECHTFFFTLVWFWFAAVIEQVAYFVVSNHLTDYLWSDVFISDSVSQILFYYQPTNHMLLAIFGWVKSYTELHMKCLLKSDHLEQGHKKRIYEWR